MVLAGKQAFTWMVVLIDLIFCSDTCLPVRPQNKLMLLLKSYVKHGVRKFLVPY